MKNKETFYITTTLPYVNSDPHIGFAIEIIRADVIARYQRLLGKEVFFNTGTDEHGLKIHEKAQEEGFTAQELTDKYSEVFKDLKDLLNLSYDSFVRTTDETHKNAAQAFWKKCDDAGYIYKKAYQAKYCSGCELEKQDSELNDGRCELHPNREIELIDEENYFFKFSEFEDKLLAFYKENPDFVIPDFRFNEIKAFVERGLHDFSISRLKEKMPWGVEVPGDPDHVMYVWFDALVNYIDVLGWPEDTENFEKFWPGIQYAGKDNLRQQTAMWQAMLMSVGLPNSKKVVLNGFVTGEGGIKMSKSLGNVVAPKEVVDEYGTEALRYFVTREISPFEDSEFTWDRFKESYNANLANGLGNLVSRTLKMATSYGVELAEGDLEFDIESYENVDFTNAIREYNHQKATDFIWEKIGELDKFITENEPFKKIKVNEEEAKKDLVHVLKGLYKVGHLLAPYLPETSSKVISAVENIEMPEPLFQRKD